MDLGDFVRGLAGAYSGYEQGRRTALQELFAQRNKEFQQNITAQEARRREDKTHSGIASAEVEQRLGEATIPLREAQAGQTREETESIESKRDIAERKFALEEPTLDLQGKVARGFLTGQLPYAEQAGEEGVRADIAEDEATQVTAGPEAAAKKAEAGAREQGAEYEGVVYNELMDLGVGPAVARNRLVQAMFENMKGRVGIEEATNALQRMPDQQKLAMLQLDQQIDVVESKFNPSEKRAFGNAMVHGHGRDQISEDIAGGRYGDPEDIDSEKVFGALETTRAIQRVVEGSFESGEARFPTGFDMVVAGQEYHVPGHQEVTEERRREETTQTDIWATRQNVEQGRIGLENQARQIENTYNLGKGNIDLNRDKLNYMQQSDAITRFTSMGIEQAINNPGAALAAIDDVENIGAISPDVANMMRQWYNIEDGPPSADEVENTLGMLKALSSATGSGNPLGVDPSQYRNFSDLPLSQQ